MIMNIYKLVAITDKKGKQTPDQREAEKVIKNHLVLLRTHEECLYIFSLSALKAKETGAVAPVLLSTSRIVEKSTTYGSTVKLKVETRNSLYEFERVAKL